VKRFLATLPACGLLCATPAWAHAHGDSGQLVSWTLDAWVLAPLGFSVLVYGIGLARLRRRSREFWTHFRGSVAVFAAGWLSLFVALVSPVHALGERSFSIHMVEHEIVMAVAAPLLVLARPFGIALWAWPRHVKTIVRQVMRAVPVRTCWRWLTAPLNATLAHGAAIWLWHWPGLFVAAVSHVAVHRLQHLCFLLTALLFWYSMLRCARSGEAVWHTFFTMLHTSLLGALLALAPHPLYWEQASTALIWTLTPLEDQQLGGILMWVPAGTVYAASILIFAARWIRDSGRAPRPGPRPKGEGLV
jgi:putative membrane protein